MNLYLFGDNLSDKGKYAKLISEYGIAHLSLRQVLQDLRKNDHSDLGDTVRGFSNDSDIHDDVVFLAIKNEIKKEKYSNGVCFSDFPYTIDQAKKMTSMGVNCDGVIQIEGNYKRKLSESPSITKDQLDFIERKSNYMSESETETFNFLKDLCKNGSGPVLCKIKNGLNDEQVNSEVNVSVAAISAIHKIRESHSFSIVTMPYDLENKKSNDIFLREAIHQSLMRGEVPFSPEVFYFQKNMLSTLVPEDREIVNHISKEFLKKSDRLIVIYKNENNEQNSFVNVDGKFLSRENIDLISDARKQNKQIVLVDQASLKPSSLEYKDPSASINLKPKDFSPESAVSKLGSESNDNFVIIESPYFGDAQQIIKNENYARAAAITCIQNGQIPFASHILYTQKGILDDTKSSQRRLGIEAGLVFGTICNASLMFSDLGMTPGMVEGVEKAKNLGRKVEIKNIDWFDKRYENATIKTKKPTF